MAELKKLRRRLSSSSSSTEQLISPQISSSCLSESSIDHPISFSVDKSKFPQISSSCLSESSIDHPISFSVDKSKFGHPVQSRKRCVSSENSPGKTCGKKRRKDPEKQSGAEEDIGGGEFLEATEDFKRAMREKLTVACEGMGEQQSLLSSIFTSLFITTAESEGPHEEHTFRHFKPGLSGQMIDLCDIFKPRPGREEPHRAVLTKGVAGIGKSFAVQKFSLDWAEGKENQDTDFIFCLAFREVNLSRGDKSLHELLTEFHPALSRFSNSEAYTEARATVILDGLDESRLQLDFQKKPVTSGSEVTSVGNLIANIIKGNLLPKANLWITSRPAAVSQIPEEFIDMVTEIRGFSDPQKEEFFRRRFSEDSGLAERIISHIHSSQSLDIMCHIPIFCWISAVLFKEVFAEDDRAETPQTLTEMMSYFLFAQSKRRNRKYDTKAAQSRGGFLQRYREFLLKLGKLAFVQLQKNNLIFYDEDLEDCGVDIKEASIYSGFCSAILREEKLTSQRKIFFFVHLTIQEFFAALFVYDCFINKKTEEFGNFLDVEDEDLTVLDLLKMTVEKVLEKKNGHLDFFLQFLLGLMVESNRRILQGLLTSPDQSEDTNKKILTHLRTIRRKDLSPDSCINLFQTMVEMRDRKVKDEIQEFLTLSDQSKTPLTSLHCSALAYMLQVSKEDLEVLDLKTYRTSAEGRRRLIPAVRSSRKAILADCGVTGEWVEHLAFGLRFPYSPLRDLDLSNNDLKDSGVKLLCGGLSSVWCRLKVLKLSGCLVTGDGCVFLASAIKSNPTHLAELDLSYNNLGDSGEKILTDLRDDDHFNLSELKVEHGGSHRMKPGFKKYLCELTWDPKTAHSKLVLSESNRKVTWVEEGHQTEELDPRRPLLAQQGLEERCYWEVEVVEPFSIGLTYKSTGRRGGFFSLGSNDTSWCLICADDGCFVTHNNEKISVSSLCSRSSRVGVYLDWPDGTLSFYRVSSDSRVFLHTYKTTFSEPLYPALQLHSQAFAVFCQPT